MAWKNKSYHGPDIMIKLMRATNVPWQCRSMRNGWLVSNGQYREQYQPSTNRQQWLLLHQPLKADTRAFITQPRDIGDYERELRNLHSQSSSAITNPVEAPHSKYVSMTSSAADANWGMGMNPTVVFRFDIWRSDVWKGQHDLSRDPLLGAWLTATLLQMPEQARNEVLATIIPPDWDRGAEFEWLALGGTRIYNVEESNDGVHWVPSVAGTPDTDVWYEAIAV
ncbi:MAG TPA: hypothetical protein VFJ16_12255 [Longimicrobium sp.]|nr:hypothetical protein [Longimicrobium sp.]